MSILLLLIDLFLKPEAPKTSFNERFLGYGLLLIATGVGLYFLFQALIPTIGYLESGAAVCLILAALGSFLLLHSRDKKTIKPVEQILDTAKSAYNSVDVDLESFLKKNTTSIILYSCLAGFTLYQIVNLMKSKSSKD